MKNIFKSLMLVAVAATTFTACEKDNNKANKVEQKTVIEFTAGFENDTRSGFASEKDGENYKSVWYGNESIMVVVTDALGDTKTVWGSVDALPDGVDSSESAHFEVEFYDELPSSGTIEVFVGNWYTSGTPNIGEYQSYNNYSVGASSHLCKSNTIEYTEGVPSSLSLTFTPEVAFGKITMEQFEANAISEVIVTLNDDIKYTLTPEVGADITLPVAWFACEADLVVNSIAVTANVNGVEYFKRVDGLDVTFNKNKVRPINVTNMTEKPADYNLNYTKCEYVGEANNYAGKSCGFKFTNNDNNYMVIAFHPNDVVDGTLPVGTFGVGALSPRNVYGNGSYFDAETSATFGLGYVAYIQHGSVIITKSDDTYSVVVDVKNLYTPSGYKTVNAKFEGSVEGNKSGVDTSGYTALTTATHSINGSTLWVKDSNYEVNFGLYNGGAGEVIIPNEYTFGGGISIEGSVSGLTLLDGSKATIYDNGDGTYTILFDVKFGNILMTQTGKYYYTFSN